MDRTHERRRRRLWLAIGKHLPDLVCAQMPSRGDQLLAVCLRELRGKQPDRRQVQIPAAQSLQNLRMTPRGSSGLNPFVRDPFCEMEHLAAVGEHRGASLLEIELPRIDLAQVNEQLGLDGITALNEFLETLK